MKRDAARRVTGTWIRRCRTDIDLAPADLAAALAARGLARSTPTIRAYEAGRRIPPEPVIAALADVLGSEPPPDELPRDLDPAVVEALRLVVREELTAFAGPMGAALAALLRAEGGGEDPAMGYAVEQLQHWASGGTTPSPRPTVDRRARSE